MHDTRAFRGFSLDTGTWSDDLALGFAGLGLVLLGALVWTRRNQPRDRYHNGLAWLRAGTYFCVCGFLAAATGVTERVFSPGSWTARTGDPAWVLTTLAFLAVVVHGYFIAWPRGTYCEDRKVYWTARPFGLVWGLSEAQLHLSVWALLEMTGLSTPWVAGLQFLAMSATFPWHVLYWDRYVSPAHNILEWNGRKVLLAHMPNTLLGIAYFASFKDPTFYVAIECLSLVAAAHAQRFPPPWRSEWHGRKILPEGGVPAATLGLDARTLQPLPDAHAVARMPS